MNSSIVTRWIACAFTGQVPAQLPDTITELMNNCVSATFMIPSLDPITRRSVNLVPSSTHVDLMPWTEFVSNGLTYVVPKVTMHTTPSYKASNYGFGELNTIVHTRNSISVSNIATAIEPWNRTVSVCDYVRNSTADPFVLNEYDFGTEVILTSLAVRQGGTPLSGGTTQPVAIEYLSGGVWVDTGKTYTAALMTNSFAFDAPVRTTKLRFRATSATLLAISVSSLCCLFEGHYVSAPTVPNKVTYIVFIPASKPLSPMVDWYVQGLNAGGGTRSPTNKDYWAYGLSVTDDLTQVAQSDILIPNAYVGNTSPATIPKVNLVPISCIGTSL
ncbi:hypothetical protein fHeYen902_310c [Yersinia phage fHe-Yen9-02]|nr:hypothetical protein fHeYen902_310c [Yersinia phage fHe-Yen9-02]